MRVPLSLFVLSLCGLAAAIVHPTRPEWLLLASSCAFASLILLLRSWWESRDTGDWIILDGSNVMHWRNGEPSLETLREVLSTLKTAGLRPAVVFDANAGYKIANRYMSDRDFARSLDLPVNRVMIAPKDSPADPLILRAAVDLNARVVTNDRYRDWATDRAELKQDSLIQGGFERGELWLSL